MPQALRQAASTGINRCECGHQIRSRLCAPRAEEIYRGRWIPPKTSDAASALLMARPPVSDAGWPERRPFRSTRIKTCVARSASNTILVTVGDCSGLLSIEPRRAIGLIVGAGRAAADG